MLGCWLPWLWGLLSVTAAKAVAVAVVQTAHRIAPVVPKNGKKNKLAQIFRFIVDKTRLLSYDVSVKERGRSTIGGVPFFIIVWRLYYE